MTDCCCRCFEYLYLFSYCVFFFPPCALSFPPYSESWVFSLLLSDLEWSFRKPVKFKSKCRVNTELLKTCYACVCLCIRPVWRGGIALFPLSLCQLKGFPSVVTEMRGWCQHVLYCRLVQMLPIMIVFCSLHVQISPSSTA